MCSLLFSIVLVSCASGKYDFDFANSSEALGCYQQFSADLQDKSKVTSKEAASIIKEWHEVRDTVLAYLQTDSAYYAHAWLPARYSRTDDSVKTQIINLVLAQNYSLKDVAIIKRGSSLFADEEEVKTTVREVYPFFSRLDSIATYETDKHSILSMYRSFLRLTQSNGFNTTDDLAAFIQHEDRIFRTFLLHFGEFQGEDLTDVTQITESLCKSIFQSATQGKLDSKTTLLYMSMRSNRRILQNAEVCIGEFKSRRKMEPALQNAYYWICLQPFITIDPLGMTLLTEAQFEHVCSVADELQRLDKSGRTGADAGRLPQMVNLLLKLYLTSQ
ncbi:MAG: hypothetical protein Q4B58_06225 [Bacteroidales bacterium]|nr:hypothetical protein [Bacteroidales bacterium]